jgi:hypothetical protein
MVEQEMGYSVKKEVIFMPSCACLYTVLFMVL